METNPKGNSPMRWLRSGPGAGSVSQWRRAELWIAFFIVASACLLAAALLFMRAQAEASSRRLTTSLAQVIAEQTSRTLQSVDGRLEVAASRLQAMQAQGTATEEAVRTMLLGQLDALPFVRAIWVLDRNGSVIFDTDVGTTGRNEADREYFRAYKDTPGLVFFVGPVVRSRVNQAWLMSASRSIRTPEGEFGGLLVAAVEPEHFEQVWREIDLGQGGSVTLLRRDGRIMVRSPADEAALSRNFSDDPLFMKHLASSPQGSFVRQSPLDGVKRSAAYRVLSTYPELLVTVGLSYEMMLQPWRRFALLTGGVWLLAVLVALGLAWQLQRHSRQRDQTALRFTQLAQAMPQIVFISDAAGNVQFMNEQWTSATGLPCESAHGSGWMAQVHPDDRAATARSLLATVRSGEPVRQEHRLLYADGIYRWQMLRAVPVLGADGRVASWFGTSTEIDALKTAQEQLTQQAERLTIAGQLARMGAWRIDAGTQRLDWSDEAAAILDLPAGSTPLAQEVIAMLTPESAARSNEAVAQCLQHGTPFDIEIELTTVAGRHAWVRSIGRAVRDAEGRIVRIEGAQQDITQRVELLAEVKELNARLEDKVAERTSALARQEALFRALAEQAPLPIWMVNPQGQATFFSRAWYEIFGGRAPLWFGYEWVGLVHPDDVNAMTANWLTCRYSGNTFAGTRRMRAVDGSWRTTTYRATPVRDGNGAIDFWVGVDTDITEITAHEAALELANAQLQSFSYSVSHDLQSPLQRIGSFAQLLEREIGPEPGSKARHYLNRIRANTQYMTQLIEGLLALARVEQVDMVRGAVNLSAMAAEVIEQLQADQPARKVACTIDQGMTAYGDARLMRSVMENLLGNAWKFTAHEAQPEITFGGSLERGEFFVRDNGVGFDMVYAGKLFGTFQRLHRDDEFPGTGIGLATVARAVARQGGRVWAEAEPGQGATFFFTLPAVPPGT